MTNLYNPDVLTCLANLSNDEVFTPPSLVNEMLDLLPASLWSDPNATFLDPCTKTGVFLREIASRLNKGLESKVPDLQQRVDHILTKQVFGLAITELTAFVSRRSLYCSKYADGEKSIGTAFTDEQGNILFSRQKHNFYNGQCAFCGASQAVFDREDVLESHAYQFIHTDHPEEILKMKFDVIIGNPPYQMNDGGFGKSASPIYHKFVQQAKKMNPQFLVMIIPSRWFAGGKGLDDFREDMLNDARLKHLVDYENASECFPGVDIAGGVCYFLWDSQYDGLCKIVNLLNGYESVDIRSLNEYQTLIRHNAAVSIIRKVTAKYSEFMDLVVSSRKPFGLPTNTIPLTEGDILLKWNGGTGFYKRKLITIGLEQIDKWKVITSKVSYDHAGQPDNQGMRRVLSKIEILPPGSICTETYIIVNSFSNETQARQLLRFLHTKFVRFLISQLSFSQDITKERFSIVPILPMNQSWSDELLYEHFSLTKEEIDYVENRIKPMDVKDAE